jgi:hypothetical protein
MNTVFTLRSSFCACSLIGSLLCSVATAQTNKFSLSVNVSPVYSGSFNERSIRIPTTQAQPINPVFTRSSISYGYSVGLSAHYAFSSRWSATTGLWVNNFTRAKSTFLFNTNTNGIITSTSAGTRVSARTYQVPLLGNYRTSDRKLAAYFSAGALISIPPEATDYILGHNNDEVLLRGRRMAVFPMIGAGLSYQLNRRFSLLTQPTLMVEFPVDEYILHNAYRVGLLTQLMYTF